MIEFILGFFTVPVLTAIAGFVGYPVLTRSLRFVSRGLVSLLDKGIRVLAEKAKEIEKEIKD